MARLRFVPLVLAIVAVFAFATPASAATGIFTIQIIGPGAIATWTTAPDGPADEGHYTDTMLFAARQLNAPGSGGFFAGAQFLQVSYHMVDGEAWWDSWMFGNMWLPEGEASVAIRQPLASAAASGSGPLMTCTESGCSELGSMSFRASWVGTGPISRGHNHPEISMTPGVSVYLASGSDVFNRAVGDLDVSFTGAAIPDGSRLVNGGWSPAGLEGTKLFEAHFGFISICHNGTPDLSDGLPAPCIPDA